MSEPTRPPFMTPSMAMMLSATGPFTLIAFLAMAGVHIALWMIILAFLSTISIFVSAIRLAMSEQKNAPKFVGEVDTLVRGWQTLPEQPILPIEPLEWHRKDRDTDIELAYAPEDSVITEFAAAFAGPASMVLERLPEQRRQVVTDELLLHYASFVSPSTRRIPTTSSFSDVLHVAFLNPDGRRVLVLSNHGEERTIAIEDRGDVIEVTLEAESVTTLLWT